MLKELDKSFMDIVNEPLDPSLIRKDYIGNKYITGYTIVKLLNRLTNGAWDWKIDNFWKDKITHKYKKNGKIIEDGEREILHMVGTLTLKFRDKDGEIIEISKQGFAGKEIQESVKVAENVYKAVETMALRKAASYFGVGAELWLNDEEKEFLKLMDMEEIWNEEMIEQHAEDFAEIARIQEENDIADDVLDEIVSEWNKSYSSLETITPEDLPEFVKFLSSSFKER